MVQSYNLHIAAQHILRSILLRRCLPAVSWRLMLMHRVIAGETWSEPQDLSSSTKAPGVGWVSTMDSGVQLRSGRLAIPMDYIHGQWSSYPITHARSSVLYSDDHGEAGRVMS